MLPPMARSYSRAKISDTKPLEHVGDNFIGHFVYRVAVSRIVGVAPRKVSPFLRLLLLRLMMTMPDDGRFAPLGASIDIHPPAGKGEGE